MPLRFSDYQHPFKNNTLIVSAGTVTCKRVANMGAGFNFFKTTFPNMDTRKLQESLDNYHDKNLPMPPFQVLITASNGGVTLHGAVATVPSLTDKKTLKKTRYLYDTAEEEYKSAVREALQYAKNNNFPVFLQPLGINTYGWAPEVAAHLVATVIQEVDPKGDLDITVPIYNPVTNSNDDVYARALLGEVKEKCPDKYKLSDDQEKLSIVVGKVIEDISSRVGGSTSDKVGQLNRINYRLKTDNTLSLPDLIQEIREVVKTKRNPTIHFWKTPESIAKFETLLFTFSLDNINPSLKND